MSIPVNFDIKQGRVVGCSLPTAGSFTDVVAELRGLLGSVSGIGAAEPKQVTAYHAWVSYLSEFAPLPAGFSTPPNILSGLSPVLDLSYAPSPSEIARVKEIYARRALASAADSWWAFAASSDPPLILSNAAETGGNQNPAFSLMALWFESWTRSSFSAAPIAALNITDEKSVVPFRSRVTYAAGKSPHTAVSEIMSLYVTGQTRFLPKHIWSVLDDHFPEYGFGCKLAEPT